MKKIVRENLSEEPIMESFDYNKTYLQIYRNNDKRDFYDYIVLKGDELYNVRLAKGEKWQWKYVGKINKNKYIINGTLISNPEMKLIVIFQKYLKSEK